MTESHSVKVTFADDNYLYSTVNGTRETITKYYLGQTFNLGDGNGGDCMVKCVKVEFLADNNDNKDDNATKQKDSANPQR